MYVALQVYIMCRCGLNILLHYIFVYVALQACIRCRLSMNTLLHYIILYVTLPVYISYRRFTNTLLHYIVLYVTLPVYMRLELKTPRYNCTGWLGVKHQFTYLLSILFFYITDIDITVALLLQLEPGASHRVLPPVHVRLACRHWGGDRPLHHLAGSGHCLQGGRAEVQGTAQESRGWAG